jgi:hypothetical protein
VQRQIASVGMGNVLSREKREQVIALGRLGWSLRRIEESTGVRRETASEYLSSAGIPLRSPGGWGHHGPAKPAIEVTTDFDQGSAPKPAIRVTTDSGAPGSKPAIGVMTGFLLEKTSSKQNTGRSFSACDPYRELIELELGRGRNAMGIFQDLVDVHGLPPQTHRRL